MLRNRVIFEKYHSLKMERRTSYSRIMASYANDKANKYLENVQFDVPLFSTRLIYARSNQKGAHLYVEPFNQFFVNLENIPFGFEPFIMAML